MITGVVKAREGRVRVKVRGPGRREKEIRAIVDTGYTSFLSLPPALVKWLGLKWKSFGRGELADGSEILFDVFEGTIVWDGKERRVRIDETDSEPLIGMGLLTGYELNIQVRSGGKLTIRKLRR